jgi:O-antigen/teichoic acid export membrane protein
MSAVGRNILALYGANALTAVAGFLATPVYLHYLGIEAYGLTGILVTLQAWFALLDMGLTPALSRSVTQFAAGSRDGSWIWSIVKGLERLYGGVAAVATVLMVAIAPWAATSWLHTQQLAKNDVVASLALMGIILGSRLWCGLYIGGITGFQRLTWLSGFTAISAVLRILLSLAVLEWISPSIILLMSLQAALSVGECLFLRSAFIRMLPIAGRDSPLDWRTLRDIRGYSGGIAAIAVVSVLLTSLDKLILSRLLPLEAFGCYMVAVTASAFLYRLIMPVYSAVQPRLTELASRKDSDGFVRVYHRAAEAVSVMVIPAAAMLVVFPSQILQVWTGNHTVAIDAAAILRLLGLATMLHGFMFVPYAAQLAHGWTSLSLKINLVMVALLVPTMIVGVSRFGPISAAYTWLILNATYLTIGQVLMSRKILRAELVRWYAQDLLPIAVTVTITAILLHMATPKDLPRWASASILVTEASILLVVALLTSSLRSDAIHRVRSVITRIRHP